jgi:putative PEP-CTERM system TPR-repeat lipoprotein
MLKPIRQPPPRQRCFAFALGVTATLSLFAIAGCDQAKTADDYIKSAQSSRASGDISSAIADLKNALQKDPKNLPVRVLLAQFYLDLPDPIGAEAALWRAKQDGADDKIVAKPLARAQLLLGKPQVALQTSELPEDAPPQLRASMLAIKAEAYISLGRAQDAQDALAAGLALDPSSLDVLTTMARYALATGDVATAQQRLAEAQKTGGKGDELLDLEGNVAFAALDYRRSTQAYQQLLRAEPWSLAARLGVARSEIADGNAIGADANLAAVLKVSPNDAEANYLSALIAYQNNNYVAAQSRIQRALSTAKNYPPALLLAGASAYALHQYEQANAFLSQYIYQVPQYVQARKLLAAVQIAQGRPGDAVKTLSLAIDAEPNDPQLLAMVGAASAQTGDFTAADRYLAKAVELQPDNAVARTELGIARLALGQTEAGIAALEQASREDPGTLRPDVALFIAHFKEKDYAKALEAAKHLEKVYPNDAAGFDFAGATYFAQADDQAARAEFIQARALRQGDPVACRSLAILAIRGGDFAGAAQFYTEILDANPKDAGASIALAEVEDGQGQRGAATTTLQKAIEQNPDNPAPRASLGRLYIADRKYQEAASATEPALASTPKNAGLLEVAGQAELALGHIVPALSAFKTLVEVQPQASIGHRSLAAAYLAAGEPDLALAESTKSVEADPNDPTAKMILARIDIVTGNYAAARTMLDELATQYPSDALVAELRGGVNVAQNRPADAVAEFRRALDDGGDNANDRMRLAVAQVQTGQIEDAKKTLVEWVTEHPNDVAPRQALADIYLAANQLDDAQTQYETVLAAAPDDSAAENNLAWVLSRKGDGQAALSHAHHAANLAPDAPQVLDTLGVTLLQNRQVDEAIASLAKASQAAPADPEIRFHFAQALVAAGDKDRARELLRSLLAANRSFEDQEAARSLFQSLGG